jgi:hypothetical protein
MAISSSSTVAPTATLSSQGPERQPMHSCSTKQPQAHDSPWLSRRHQTWIVGSFCADALLVSGRLANNREQPGIRILVWLKSSGHGTQLVRYHRPLASVPNLPESIASGLRAT